MSLESHREKLDAIANRLIEKETLEAPELQAIVHDSATVPAV